jgi:FixJ family two-component response regulator
MLRIPLISVIDDDDALRGSLENLIRSVGLWVQGFSSGRFCTSKILYGYPIDEFYA